MAKHKVTLVPLKTTVEVNSEKNLFVELRKLGYPIKTTCGGVGTCASCVVNILEGEENLTDITFEEKKLLGNVYHITKERLSCQTFIKGDVTIDISSHLEADKPKAKIVRKTKVEVEKEQEKKEEEKNKEPEEPAFKQKKLGGNKKPKAFHYRNRDEE